MSFIHGHTITKVGDIPRDDSLPGLGAMLDREKFHTLLHSRLGDSLGVIEACSITYIRYKPETNCLVAYELTAKGTDQEEPKEIILYAKLYTKDDYVNALDKSLKVRWLEVPGQPPTLPLADQRAILYFYPNDCLIDGLRILSDPKKIQRLLYERQTDFPSEDWRISDSRLRLTTVRYKPERRAVIRVDTRAVNRHSGEKKAISVYLRIYSDDRGEEVYAFQSRLFEAACSNSRIAVPRPLGYFPERRLLMLQAVDGVELLPHLLGGDRGSITLTAKALSELHRCVNIRPSFQSDESLFKAVTDTGEFLRRVAPETSGRTAEILTRLADCHSMHDENKMVPVHGDFYYGQVLIQEHRAAIIDFDRSYMGEAAADLGNFCAHLRLLGIEGLVADVAGLESDFLEAYQSDQQHRIGDKSMRFYLAYSLLLLSIGPFRRLEEGWPQKTQAILDECLRILRG